MNPRFTPARCAIDLAAIVHNFRLLGASGELMPVIKADAYGHGLIPVALALTQAGATGFSVGIASEGIALRESGIGVPILLLMGCHSRDDWEAAITYELMPIIGSMDDLEAAAATLHEYPGKKLNVAVKCDTGMGRLGFSFQHGAAAAQALASFPNINPVMDVSHLACADMPDRDFFTVAQIHAFETFHGALKAVFPHIRHSLNNSAAVLRKLPGDIARPGLALYGGNPLGESAECDLRWAMSVSAPILAVHSLLPGQSLSYGCTFTAKSPMQVAVVPFGYATGFNRKLSGKAQMLVKGRRCPQIGTVCMSMAMLDVTGVGNVSPGDQAWILGNGSDSEDAPLDSPIDAWELASWLETIPYEILCLFGSLTPRVYHDPD